MCLLYNSGETELTECLRVVNEDKRRSDVMGRI